MAMLKSIRLENLKNLLEEYKSVFDIARIVEPESTTVVSFENGIMQKKELDPCFSVWNKEDRCDNCISVRACRTGKRLTKFEFRDDEAYSVIAVPINVISGDKEFTISLELVNNINDDLIINADGDTPGIREIKKINKKLYEDSLTGAFNRRYYDEDQYLYEKIEPMPRKLGFLVADINSFKSVNDTFGHESGDELLIAVAEVFRSCVRSTDRVIRIGGDEFLIVVKNCDKDAVEHKRNEIRHAVSEIYLESLGLYKPSVAVGMSYTDSFDGSRKMQQALFSQADAMMYKEKNVLGTEARSFSKVIRNEKALSRMNRALSDTINVYTDIDAKSLIYNQINLKDTEYFSVESSGKYEIAFEYMCQNEIHEDDIPSLKSILGAEVVRETAYDDEGPVEVRVRYRLKNSFPVKLMESRVIYIRDEEPRHAIVMATDVTEVKSLEEQNVELSNILSHIDAERKMYQGILDESAAMISIIDAETFNISYANRAALEVTTDLDTPYIGSVCYKNIANSEKPCSNCILLRQDGVTEETKELNYGSKVYQMLYKTVLWNGRKALMEYSLDITEERRMRSLEQKLAIEKKSNEAKTGFLSNMSHEIRTPMNAIIGMTRLAELESDNSAETMRYLNQIDKSSQYLLGVINDILDMSRIESGKSVLHFDWASPSELMMSCINMIEPMMEEKRITFDYPDSFKKILPYEYNVDEQKTKQMIMNILNNACKFTPEGGKVMLRVRNLEHDEKECTAVDEISVTDNGCGMSEDFLTRIFTPFEQERNQYTGSVQGTGLGLALSRNIARQMGGDITVESRLGEGSTFRITFKYNYRKVSDVAKKESKTAGSDFSVLEGKHVLLAEDNPLNAEIAVRLLQKVSVSVTKAGDGAEAVDIFAASKPGTFDAVLMDIRMPNMGGLEATQKIHSMQREDAREIPIIAMTADAFDEDRKITREAGMAAHLAKPISPELLYRTLAENIK